MDELSTVKVYCRMRPFIQREINMGNLDTVYEIPQQDRIYITQKDKTYTFDQVFGPTTSQQEIYNSITHDSISDFMDGFNVTQFAYGQSGCLDPNTDIMMFNGSTKKAKDVVVGDILMGDDSTPRNVLELFEGEQNMYEIVPERGESYKVNEDHVLTLVNIVNPFIQWCEKDNRYEVHWYQNDGKKRNKYFQVHGEDIKPHRGNLHNITKQDAKNNAEEFMNNLPDCNKLIDISVKDYLQKSKSWKRFHLGIRCPVEFSHKEVPIDPYMLGLWLGGSCSSSPTITTIDHEIIDYLYEFARGINCKVTHLKQNNPICYRISSLERRHNRFWDFLKGYNLVKNKYIPDIYKYNSKKVRLQVLAGLLDSDGYYKGSSYDFIQKKEKLFDDVLWLARSLGFGCYKSECTKTCTNGKDGPVSNTYYRCNIGGRNIHEIPCKINRKKAENKSKIKNNNNYALHVSINVNPLGKGRYNGFRLDGNHRFLLGDFTCTHNSGKTFSVMGRKGDDRLEGIIPRSVKRIFEMIDNDKDGSYFEIEVSYLEIYMERVNDLLDHNKQNLTIRQDPINGVYVQDLTREFVSNIDDVYDILKRGDSVRKVTATKLNEGSSRSHSILSIYVSQTRRDRSCITSRLNLVDLAGSERADKTKATGDVLKQGALINLSLTILSQVIHALSVISVNEGDASKVPIPYRDSKLTRLLQSSLGGNSKTSLIIHISPHVDNIDETISTLEFGKRTALIKNKATRIIKKSVEQLEHELEKLRADYNALLENGLPTKVETPKLVSSVSFTRSTENSNKVKELEEEVDHLHQENDALKKEIETFEDLLNELGGRKVKDAIIMSVKKMKEENTELRQQNYIVSEELADKTARLAKTELECLRNNISLGKDAKKNKKIKVKVKPRYKY